jgi:hypothetical protein
MVCRWLDNGDRVTLINELVQMGQRHHMGMAPSGQNQFLFHRFLSGLKQLAQQRQMGAFFLGDLNQRRFAVVVFGSFRSPAWAIHFIIPTYPVLPSSNQYTELVPSRL